MRRATRAIRALAAVPVVMVPLSVPVTTARVATASEIVATSPARTPSAADAAGDKTRSRWVPRPGLSWQIQYSGRIDTSLRVQAYDLDGEETPAATVGGLHRRGIRAICYISAGSYEDYRTDAHRFPRTVVGRPLEGWPGERWLDIRRRDVLVPIMADRMRRCAAKGFDAVDADNVDGYETSTGFPLTGRDELRYVRELASQAHRFGLAYGLKNDLEQVASLARDVDFAVNEQCVETRECAAYAPMVAAGKPVLHIEYRVPSAGCVASPRGFSTLMKRRALDAWRRVCAH